MHRCCDKAFLLLFFSGALLLSIAVAERWLRLGYGPFLTLFEILLSNLASLGLLIAARVTSEELAGGLLNMISWPMMILSGVWFSLEGAGPAVQGLLNFGGGDLTHVPGAVTRCLRQSQ